MTPTPWLLILVILVLLGCSTAPAIPTPTPEPVPRRVSFDINGVKFQDELSQPFIGNFQWLKGASISELGVTLSGATTTLTEIELTARRLSKSPRARDLNKCGINPYSSSGNWTLCDQAFDVAISPGRVATGVFAIVTFTLNNVSDSTMLISTTDFSLLDENLVSTQISLESTGRNAKTILSNLGDDWRNNQPFIQLPTDPNTFMIFEDLEVRALSNVRIRVVFDIPRTGVERKLKLRFRDDPPVDLVVGE